MTPWSEVFITIGAAVAVGALGAVIVHLIDKHIDRRKR